MIDFSRLPKGISSFPELRNSGRVYVDKTDLIHQLIQRESFVFLSRPRRFGKSLLVSTLASLFEHGLRDFKGLAIEKTWKDKTYPVVTLDFSCLKGTSSKEEFERVFESYLAENFKPLGFQYDSSSFGTFMIELGGFLSNPPCGRIVLLIDECDAPLTEQLNNETFFDDIQSAIAAFYRILKSESGSLRFLFITGITKYRRVSIFSELNNLTDISLDPQFGELLGYTRKEIEKYFPEFLDNAVENLSSSTGISYTRDSLMQEMIANYGGFCFDEQAKTHVFAPWSVLNFLAAPSNGFKNYWISSGGVSTWLENWMASHGAIDPERFNKTVTVDTSELDAASKPADISVNALLFQTGCLSIVGAEFSSYVDLGYPNDEVSTAMAKLFLNHTSKLDKEAMCDIARVLESGAIEEVIGAFNNLYMSIPYDHTPIRNEAAARAIILAYAKGAQLMSLAECHNAKGRSDLEINAGKRHWVFEFKYAKEAAGVPKALEDAIEQIQKNQYGASTSTRELIRVGVVYSGEQRQIVAWKTVE